MSIEPTCSFCGKSVKPRCRTREEAADCSMRVGDRFDFDFGFTDQKLAPAPRLSDDAHRVSALQNENTSLRARLDSMYFLIVPFLDRLSKSPDKDIRWPGRDKQIAEFKKKLRAIVDDTQTTGES